MEEEKPIDRLMDGAVELNQEADLLRDRIFAIEEALNKMNVGLEAEFGDWGFGRCGNGRWGFYKNEAIPDSTNQKGIRTRRRGFRELSRTERNEIAPHIGEIINKLVEGASTLTKATREANAALSEEMKKLGNLAP